MLHNGLDLLTHSRRNDDEPVAASTRRGVVEVMVDHRQAARDGVDSLWWVNSELHELFRAEYTASMPAMTATVYTHC